MVIGITRIRETACVIGAILLSATAANAVVINDDCLAYGDCVVSGSFTPHPTLAPFGIWQAAEPFTVETVGAFFYGRTSPLSVDADWSIADQNGSGLTRYIAAGNSEDIVFARAPLQEPVFQLVVDALYGLAGPMGETFSITVSNQSISDAILTRDLRNDGFLIETDLITLRRNFGLDANADGDAIRTALTNVPAVPLPAAGWLLLVGLCGLRLVRRKSA